jgi:hypothetical protein
MIEMSNQPKYNRTIVLEKNANIFAVIGYVRREMIREGSTTAEVSAFVQDVTSTNSYEEAMDICRSMVTIQEI